MVNVKLQTLCGAVKYIAIRDNQIGESFIVPFVVPLRGNYFTSLSIEDESPIYCRVFTYQGIVRECGNDYSLYIERFKEPPEEITSKTLRDSAIEWLKENRK